MRSSWAMTGPNEKKVNRSLPESLFLTRTANGSAIPNDLSTSRMLSFHRITQTHPSVGATGPMDWSKCNLWIAIPMIMRWPGKVEAGQVNEDLTMSIDICATVLEAAGVKAPVLLHGKSLLGDEVKNRKYVFAARDKMDNVHDSMRTIRSKDFKLILNLMPERPWLQFSRYKEQCYPMLAEMGAMHLRGELTPQQAAFYAPSKPEIELFDLKKDPHEVNNIADDPAFAEKRAELLTALNDWRENVIHDQGVSDEFRGLGKFPESLRGDLSVDQWVLKNRDQLDPEFFKHGWPTWFPTRSQEQWEEAIETWKPYVFREPNEKVERPLVAHQSKPKPKKKKAAAR